MFYNKGTKYANKSAINQAASAQQGRGAAARKKGRGRRVNCRLAL